MSKNLYFIGNSHLDQFRIKENIGKIKNRFENIDTLCIPGASIKGLNNEQSLTGLNKLINKIDNSNNILIFHLGQVDIEFGYYFKSIKQGKKININLFIEEIANIYEDYLKKIKSKKIIIGLNPSVIKNTEHIFYVNFKDKVCHANNKIQETGILDSNINFEDVKDYYNDSIEQRNLNLKLLNSKIRDICQKNNFIFCDLWDVLTDNNLIKDKFNPQKNDHHIIPNDELFNIVNNILEKNYN